MKLRLIQNSVRVRVSQTEAAQLAEGKSVEQSTLFSESAKLTCTLEPATGITDVHLLFEGTRLSIRIPLAQAKQWGTTDQVAIEFDQPIDADRSIRILIEKDFECLHPRIDDSDDAFPNPQAI